MKIIEKLIDYYLELRKKDEEAQVIIFIHKKELGWELLKLLKEKNYKIINKTLPFKVEYEDANIYDFGFHNADIPIEEKEEIENAFRRGKLKCLIATQTMAYGVNLPADHVIILVKSFFNQGKHQLLPSPLDIIQMKGRAGRFGIKEKGYVHVLLYRICEENYKNITNKIFEEAITSIHDSLKNIEKFFENYLGDSATLSSFILSAYKMSRGNIRNFLKNTYSFRNFYDFRKIYRIVDFLQEKGYIENYYLTEKGEFCLYTGIPPTAYEEFLNRMTVNGSMFVKVRPLIYNKRISGAFNSFLDPQEIKKDEILAEISKFPFLTVETDGSIELLFYIKGEILLIQNIHNPPSEVYFDTEAIHLGKNLIKLSNKFFITYEEILRIVHSLRYGLELEFSPIGSIPSIGHIRANAIKTVLKDKKVKILDFDMKVESILDNLDKELLESLLTYRYSKKDILEKEIKTIYKILEQYKDKMLVDERILRSLSLFKLERDVALKTPVEELYAKFRET